MFLFHLFIHLPLLIQIWWSSAQHFLQQQRSKQQMWSLQRTSVCVCLWVSPRWTCQKPPHPWEMLVTKDNFEGVQCSLEANQFLSLTVWEFSVELTNLKSLHWTQQDFRISRSSRVSLGLSDSSSIGSQDSSHIFVAIICTCAVFLMDYKLANNPHFMFHLQARNIIAESRKTHCSVDVLP